MPHFYWGSLQLSPANSQSQQTWRLSFFLFASESAKTQVVNKQTLLFSWLVLVYFHSCRDKPGGAAHREACHRYWFSFFLSNGSGMLKNASIVCKFYYFNWESFGTALLLIHGTLIYLRTVVMMTMMEMRTRRTIGIITPNIYWIHARCFDKHFDHEINSWNTLEFSECISRTWGLSRTENSLSCHPPTDWPSRGFWCCQSLRATGIPMNSF